MGKATLVLVTLAALGLGLLVGFSLVDDPSEMTSTETGSTAPFVSSGGAPALRYLTPDDVPAEWYAENEDQPFLDGDNFIAYDKAWKSESLTIALAGDSRVEYKIFMSRGDAVIYRWSVAGEPLYYDLHAHDDAFGDVFYTRYSSGRTTDHAGVIVAPYDGQHGWYWQSLELEADTIRLDVAGFYDRIVEVDLEQE